MRFGESFGSVYNKNTGRAELEKSAVLPNLFRTVLIVLRCPLCYHQEEVQ